MIFHRFRRRPGRSGRALRPAEPPADPSPRPHAGELGRSELADETEAFLDGTLAELRAANDRPLAAWMVLNRICHGDSVDIFGLAADDISRAPLAGVSSAYHHVWNTVQRTIATRLLERALDPEEIRQVQRDVLIPLELRLIARSRDEPVTFAAVTADAIDALDHYQLDR